MKIKRLHFAVVFVVGIAIGWFGGSYRQGKATQKAVSLFKVIQLHEAEERAKEAYAKEPRNVAIWELRHVVHLLQGALEAEYEGPKSIKLKLFLAHARLARLTDLEGSPEQTHAYFLQAIHYYNDSHPSARIDDFNTMLERLQKFDEIAKLSGQ